MTYKLRLCGSVDRICKKNGFRDLFAQENSPKVPVLEADSSQRWADSMIFHEFVNQKVRQKVFFINFGIPTPQHPDTSLG